MENCPVSRLFIVLFCVQLSACGAPEALRGTGSNSTVLIQQVRVLDIDTGEASGLLDVLVADGVIQQISPAGEWSSDDIERIDGGGGVLVPGLIDMHVHVFDESELAANLVYGVTTIRNLGGMPFHLALIERLESGRLLGPRIISTGTILNERDGRNVNELQTLISGPEDASAAVRAQFRDGYRHLKLYSNLSRESFSAIRETAVELGLSMSGHPVEGTPSDPLDIADTLAAGFATIEHMESIVWFALNDDTDPERGQALAAQFAAAGARVSPTLIVHQNLARIVETEGAHIERSEMATFNPVVHGFEAESYAFWASHGRDDRTRMQAYYIALTGMMHRAGVDMVVGTDAGVMATPHGVSVSEEIELLVEAGLTPLEALQAATINAADALGLESEIGRVAEGYRADLVLLPHDPQQGLAVLREPQGVMRDGVWLDANALAELREVAARPDEFRTMRRIVEHMMTR